MNQSKLEVLTCSWREARENVRELVTVSFGFTSDWLKKWRDFFKPIVWRSYKKPIKFWLSSKNRSSKTGKSFLVNSVWEIITIMNCEGLLRKQLYSNSQPFKYIELVCLFTETLSAEVYLSVPKYV